MRITWLGQHGLAVESGNQLLMVDPYLLDTMHVTNGEDFARLVPVDDKWTQVHPDMILLTHDHIDHVDMPSLEAILTSSKKAEILAGANAWNKVRGKFDGDHNYIMMIPGNEWTSDVFRVRAVSARHSDSTGVGFVVDAENKRILISGDTLYFADIAKEICGSVDVAVVVINGKGNNMNAIDAARYCAAVGAKAAIPTHWGLFKKFEHDKDTPERFAEEAVKRGVRAEILPIYGSVDTEDLLEG